MSEATGEAQVERLLEQALDLPAAERESFLRRSCGSEPALLARLRRLLALAEEQGGVLERPALREEARPPGGIASAEDEPTRALPSPRRPS